MTSIVQDNRDAVEQLCRQFSVRRLQRSVDLVMISAVKNPYFLESIEQSRTLLYAA